MHSEKGFLGTAFRSLYSMAAGTSAWLGVGDPDFAALLLKRQKCPASMWPLGPSFLKG